MRDIKSRVRPNFPDYRLLVSGRTIQFPILPATKVLRSRRIISEAAALYWRQNALREEALQLLKCG